MNLSLEVQKLNKRDEHRAILKDGSGRHLHTDIIKPAKAIDRDRFVRDATERFPGLEPEPIVAELLRAAGQLGEDAGGEAAPLPLIYFNDLSASLDVADFVEGLLCDGAMSVLYGDSNTGKTFFALDLALHVAHGKPWRGRAVEVGGVVYLALEGASGVAKRVAAFKLANGCGDAELPFAVVPVGVDLRDPVADTTRVIEAVRAAASKMGGAVKLVVIDTLSRALAGGNENASEDMGALVSNIDRIRQETSAHAMLIHHSGKDGAKGARGHSLLRAATDTEIEVSRDVEAGVSVARVTKQREMEVGDAFAFTLEPVELGENRRGKPVTSCVVRDAEPPVREPRLSNDQKTAFSILCDLIGSEGKAGAAGIPNGRRSVDENRWRECVYSQTKAGATQDAKKKSFRRSADGLEAVGKVRVCNGRVWIP